MSRSLLEDAEIVSEDECENGVDYTLIRRPPTSPADSSKGSVSPSGESTARSSPKLVSFKCSQCFKPIEVGRPMYMRNDFPYCSKECRELGVSSIYRVIFGSSVDNDTGFVTRLLKQIGGSSASISSMEDTEEEIDDTRADPSVATAARARAKSFLKSIVGSVSKTSLGSSFIRTYSSSILWGKDLTRNTSFNTIFAYLPEIPEAQPLSDPVSARLVSTPSSSSSR
jgi:hypothetical protein